MTEYRREVSAAEKAMIAINEVRPPFVIQMVLEGDGDPEPEALFDALQATTKANPGSSLMLDTSGPYETWKIGPVPTLTVLEEPELEIDSDEAAPFFRWAMDARTGPTTELVSVRGKSKHYLVFRALHAVMDGQGTILWVKDFMRCLRGEEPVGHPSTLCVDQLIRELNAEKRPILPTDAIHPFGQADLSRTNAYHWKRLRIERPLDSGAGGRIGAALAQRARRDGKKGNFRINLPTDLRHYRPEERTTANMFSTLGIDVPEGATADAVAFKVVQLLYRQEGARPFAMFQPEEAASLDIYRVKAIWDMAHLHDTGLYGFSMSLSHLGGLRGADLSGPGFTPTSAFFVPLVGDSGCVVHINGFDEETQVTVGLSDHFLGSGQLDELAEIVQTALESAAKSKA